MPVEVLEPVDEPLRVLVGAVEDALGAEHPADQSKRPVKQVSGSVCPVSSIECTRAHVSGRGCRDVMARTDPAPVMILLAERVLIHCLLQVPVVCLEDLDSQLVVGDPTDLPEQSKVTPLLRGEEIFHLFTAASASTSEITYAKATSALAERGLVLETSSSTRSIIP